MYVWLENGSTTTFCSSRMVEIEPVIPHCTCTIDSTSTLDVQVLFIHSTCRYSVLYQYHDSTIVIDSYYAVGIVMYML